MVLEKSLLSCALDENFPSIGMVNDPHDSGYWVLEMAQNVEHGDMVLHLIRLYGQWGMIWLYP